jgi:transcription elongation factor Elf1
MCGCGRTNFSSMFIQPDEKTFKCPKCGMEFTSLGFSNRENRMPLYLGCKFYKCEISPDSDDFTSVAGELVENKLKKGILGIKNCSDKSWQVKMPDGKMYDIASGKGFPVWQGLEIDFGGVRAYI